MSEEIIDHKNTYFNIINGEFRTRVTEDTEGAIAREYETKDGAKAVKWERPVSALKGVVTDIYFREGEYGKSVMIMLDENSDGQTPVIQLGVSSNYGEDFLKKLPNMKLDNEVMLRPYAFEENSKEKRGIAVTQCDEEGNFTVKCYDYFIEMKEVEGKNVYTQLHGYPTPEKSNKEMDKEDWKIYFIQTRKFLVNYAEENILNKFTKETPKKKIDYPENEVDGEDSPF